MNLKFEKKANLDVIVQCSFRIIQSKERDFRDRIGWSLSQAVETVYFAILHDQLAILLSDVTCIDINKDYNIIQTTLKCHCMLLVVINFG